MLARQYRRSIHRYPELGHHEHRTADYVERVLIAFGLRPIRPAPTSVAVVVGIDGQRPRMGFRADMDALPMMELTRHPYVSQVPGTMHACGHDGHAAALLVLARRLVERPAGRGSVLLVFQQAEEVHPSGAPLVLAGLSDVLMPDEFYAAHLWPELDEGVIGIRSGTLFATVAGLTIRIRGATGRAHGSAAEAGGIHAVDAGLKLYQAFVPPASSRNLSEHLRWHIFVGRFDGGEHPHKVAAHCLLRGTIRAMDWPDLDDAVAAVRHQARRIAMTTGADIDVDIERGIRPPVCNSARCVARVVEACSSTGTAWCSYPAQTLGVSDDFGWFLEGRQGALLLLGCGSGTERADLHTPTFDFREEVLLAGVDVLEALARSGASGMPEVHV
jgi:amidohydrolase